MPNNEGVLSAFCQQTGLDKDSYDIESSEVGVRGDKLRTRCHYVISKKDSNLKYEVKPAITDGNLGSPYNILFYHKLNEKLGIGTKVNGFITDNDSLMLFQQYSQQQSASKKRRLNFNVSSPEFSPNNLEFEDPVQDQVINLIKNLCFYKHTRCPGDDPRNAKLIDGFELDNKRSDNFVNESRKFSADIASQIEQQTTQNNNALKAALTKLFFGGTDSAFNQAVESSFNEVNELINKSSIQEKEYFLGLLDSRKECTLHGVKTFLENENIKKVQESKINDSILSGGNLVLLSASTLDENLTTNKSAGL